MTAWSAPITFSSGTILTAAQMNAEVRDHAVWLKAALDIITNTTAADTGATTYININRAAAADPTFRSAVSGDTQPRIIVQADGKLTWGSGSGAHDTNLYRTSADTLKTDDSLVVGSTFWLNSSVGFLEISEVTAPSAATANTARLYAVDVAGKTRLAVVFPTGAAQTIATEP